MSRLVIRRRRGAAAVPAQHLLEVVSPRTNAALISPAAHLCGALTRHAGAADGGPVALEIAADAERRRFLVRTATLEQQQHVAGQVGAAYPQALLRPAGPSPGSDPDGPRLLADPAAPGPGEQLAACVLHPRAGEHLPLRTFADRELDADAGPSQTDPVLGILGALGDLPPDWRALAQLLLLAPAAPGWARVHQRRALEDPVRAGQGSFLGGLLLPLGLLGLAGLLAAGWAALDAWDRGDVLGVVQAAAVPVLALALGGLALRLAARVPEDPQLVRDKLACDAARAELRLVVAAPTGTDPAAVRTRLDRLAAAYRPFGLAAGNSLIPRPVRGRTPIDPRVLVPLGRRRGALLNVRELAGLWHLPQAADDVPFLERTTARCRLPLPATVAPGPGGSGCRIGLSVHQGHAVPVTLHPDLLRRHLLAVAKTRRGKSSLLLRMVSSLMRAQGAERRGLVLVDPHRDLATAALGLVPPGRRGDVVGLDVANRARPFGVNLLDVGLGWDRDQAVSNGLRIFRREFVGFWGPRMEDAFRFALLALFEANEAMVRAEPARGRFAQHTVLEVPALLSLRGFRRRVLKRTVDPAIAEWFETYFEGLEPKQRLEIINPVITKVHRYMGSKVARAIVGQPCSTVDFRSLVADGKIVIVNLHAFDVSEDTAALVGGTLLNLAARAISAQATLPPEERRSVTLLVDEFHTIPGADYEQVFGELAKYGANMILATQTLSRLDRLTDSESGRDLRAAVFSNLDGLFAFHTSAEDARYLAPELGGGLDEQDVLELGYYTCYARLTDVRTGERLPAFSVRLDPPPEADPHVAMELAQASAERYGRDALDVALDLQAAIERVRGPGRPPESAPEANDYPEPPPVPDEGTRAPSGTVTGGAPPDPEPPAPASREEQ